MKVLVSTIAILALLPCCVYAGAIGLGDFSPDAVVEEYDSVSGGPYLPTPLLIGGDTYTSFSGVIEIGSFLGAHAGGSGPGLSVYTDGGYIDIEFETPTSKVGLYVGLDTSWMAQVRFFNEDGAVLGTVYPSGSGGDGVFVGWEADVGLVASLHVEDTWEEGRMLYIDHLTKEALIPDFPVLPDIPDQTAPLGELFTYDVDAVSAIPCVYELVDDPLIGLTIDPDTGVIEWTPTGLHIGTRSITVRATNSAGADETTFKIRVPKVAPEITPIPDATAYVGQEWAYQVLFETWYLNPVPDRTLIECPEGMTMLGDNIRWTPTVLQVGEHLVTVKAENSIGYDIDSFIIEVVDDGQPRRFTLTIDGGGSGQITPGIGEFEYPEGTVVSVEAVPDPGAHFVVWSGTAVTRGKVADRTSPTTSLTMYEDYTLWMRFRQNTTNPHNLYIYEPQSGGGYVWKPGQGWFERLHDSNFSLVACSQEGYRFVRWGGSAATTGAIADLTNPMQSLHMVADYTVMPWFEPSSDVEYTLTVSSTEGGEAEEPGEGSFQYWDGAIVHIRADKEPNHRFTGWAGTAADAGKVSDPTDEWTMVTVDADYTVVATFEERLAVQHTLELSAGQGGHVTVPGEGTFTYDKGTQVTITATPDPGYTFSKWTGTAVEAGKVDASTVASTYVTLDDDYTLRATFRRRTLSLSSTIGGQVTAPGEGVYEYDDGEVVVIEATADDGYYFSHWSGSLSSSNRVTSITMDIDYRLQANFIGVNDILYVEASATGEPGQDGSCEHPFDTIQEAIAAAAEHAMVIVYPGTYYEHLDFLGKSIRVTSLEGDDPGAASYPVIDGSYLDTVVTFDSSEGPGCILEGFIITRGSGQKAGGIYCDGTSPTIAHCIIVGNRATSPEGAAVYCLGGAPVLTHCTISGNGGGSEGAGVYVGAGKPVMRDSIVQDNVPCDILIGETALPQIEYCNILEAWSGATCIALDSLFVQPGHWADPTDNSVVLGAEDPDAVWIEGDYHLKSQGGHWDSDAEIWVIDQATSPCIDAGGPDSSVGSESAPNGDRINMGAYGGTYAASRSVPDLENVEDFETADFSKFDWLFYGKADWYIVQGVIDSGTFCARAGAISDNQSSSIAVHLDCKAGDISFFYKVSSQRPFDVLQFSIDNMEVSRWSGGGDWTQVSFPVEEGARYFAWKYFKNGSVSTWEDTAWIDNIVFPMQ